MAMVTFSLHLEKKIATRIRFPNILWGKEDN